MQISLVVPAAGLGSRMGSSLPKALLDLNGETVVECATRSLIKHAKSVILVVSGSNRELFQSRLTLLHGVEIAFVEQPVASGTADAVYRGLRAAHTDWVVVVWADHVGASHMKIENVLGPCRDMDIDVAIPVVRKQQPYVYFDFDDQGQPMKFYETRKGAPSIKEGWSDCGVFVLKTRTVLQFLNDVQTGRDGDVNLLALFPMMVNAGLNVQKFEMLDEILTIGTNTPGELDFARQELGGADEA